MFSATSIWQNTYLSHLADLFHRWNKSKLFCAERLSTEILPWRARINPSSSFMSNRLLQALSLIGWLLQLLLLIGPMTERRRAAQVQNITPLNQSQLQTGVLASQAVKVTFWKKWASKELLRFGESLHDWTHEGGGGSWSELNHLNKFCLFLILQRQLGCMPLYL